MKPGDKVAWTSLSGTPLQGVVLEYNPRRHLRKEGVRLGSYTKARFYMPRCLVSFSHPSGTPGVQWILAERLSPLDQPEEKT